MAMPGMGVISVASSPSPVVSVVSSAGNVVSVTSSPGRQSTETSGEGFIARGRSPQRRATFDSSKYFHSPARTGECDSFCPRFWWSGNGGWAFALPRQFKNRNPNGFCTIIYSTWCEATKLQRAWFRETAFTIGADCKLGIRRICGDQYSNIFADCRIYDADVVTASGDELHDEGCDDIPES